MKTKNEEFAFFAPTSAKSEEDAELSVPRLWETDGDVGWRACKCAGTVENKALDLAQRRKGGHANERNETRKGIRRGEETAVRITINLHCRS